MTARSEEWRAYALLTATALFWALTVIIGRAVAGEVPPLAINFWRWTVAFALAAPFGLPVLWRERAVVRAHWRILVALALLNMTTFGSVVFFGLQFTSGVNGSLLLGTMPINIVLVSWVVLRSRVSGNAVLGVGLGFAGLATIVTRADPAVIAALDVNAGDLLIWLAIVFYALYSVWLPRAPKALSLMPLMTALFLIGALASLPLYLWETFALGRPVSPSWNAVWSIGLLGLFPSLLAQVFWVAAVRHIGANTAGYFIYLSPVFGTLMALTLLGEAFAWYHAAGIVLIFAGIYTATQAKPASGA